MLHRLQDAHRLGIEARTGAHELRAPGGAVEKFRPEVAFEVADRVAEWRLLHPDPLGRAREMQLLRNSYEVAKMTKLHEDYRETRTTRSAGMRLLDRLPHRSAPGSAVPRQHGEDAEFVERCDRAPGQRVVIIEVTVGHAGSDILAGE